MALARIALRLLFALSLALVAALSLLPPEAEPSISFLSDKMQHAAAYGWLGLIGFAAFAERRARAVLLVLLPGYGVAIELLQHFVPRRTPELADAVADLLGVLLGAGLYLLACRLGSFARAEAG